METGVLLKAIYDEKPSLTEIEGSTILAKESTSEYIKSIIDTLPILSDIKTEMVNVQYGKLSIENNQLSIWDQAGTLLVTFDLFDRNGSPTMGNVFRREIV